MVLYCRRRRSRWYSTGSTNVSLDQLQLVVALVVVVAVFEKHSRFDWNIFEEQPRAAHRQGKRAALHQEWKESHIPDVGNEALENSVFLFSFFFGVTRTPVNIFPSNSCTKYYTIYSSTRLSVRCLHCVET